MADIRRLHASRFSIINPASDMIDRCAGKQWYDVPDFWNGGRSDAFTINVEPERSVFQIIIYGELFGPTMDAVLRREPERGFDLEMRLEYIKYCIPDYMCWKGYDGGPNGNRPLEVLPVGPYTPCKRIDTLTSEQLESFSQTRLTDLANTDSAKDLTDDQVGLNHILTCRTWREAWEKVRLSIAPDFEEGWRQKLWRAAVEQQGLEGLEMLRPGGWEGWRGRLKGIRERIEGMGEGDRPGVYFYGRAACEASDAPHMANEVYVCMVGLWCR